MKEKLYFVIIYKKDQVEKVHRATSLSWVVFSTSL